MNSLGTYDAHSILFFRFQHVRQTRAYKGRREKNNIITLVVYTRVFVLKFTYY